MKKFILKCLCTIFPVMVVIYACGFYVNFYLIKVLPKAGDLGQLGYFYIDKSCNTLDIKLLENRMDTYCDTIQGKYEIMTIGDSFSQQGITGYQNYLAMELGERILNYPDPGGREYSPEEISLYLLKNGVFAKLGCKIVIIETVERSFVQRMLDIKNIENLESGNDVLTKGVPEKKKDCLMETFKYIKYYLYKSKRPVKEAQLRTDCFSVSPHNMLYFYKDDLKILSITNDENNEILNKLDYLHNCFLEEGIGLYYIIAPDKYDVYQSYIVNNPYPPKTVVEQLEENGVGQLEWFINPRAKFRKMIDDGVEDIYHIDDTHWTYKASESVGHILAQKIKDHRRE